MKKSLAVVAVAALLSGLFAGPAQAKDVKLTGGGATFANPILDACKGEFASVTGVKSGLVSILRSAERNFEMEILSAIFANS